jgi:hypothetical protein
MLSSLARFAVALTLASSILGAVIPITTAITSSTASAPTLGTLEPSHRSKGPVGALFKNSVHDKVYLSEVPAATSTAEGKFSNTSTGSFY